MHSHIGSKYLPRTWLDFMRCACIQQGLFYLIKGEKNNVIFTPVVILSYIKLRIQDIVKLVELGSYFHNF